MSKIQIREGLFETNSSSVHAMSVFTRKDKEYEIPEKIKINLNDYAFGWEEDRYFDIESKVAYLYLLAEDCGGDTTKQIEALLMAAGVKEVIVVNERNNEWSFGGYIDHGDAKVDFLLQLLKSPDLFNDFVFNPVSYVETGNDNVWEHEDIPTPNSSADYQFVGGN